MQFVWVISLFTVSVTSAPAVVQLLDQLRPQIRVPGYTPEDRLLVAQTIKKFIQVNHIN